MKVSYEQVVRVELPQKPSVDDIEKAIAAMRSEARARLDGAWDERVAIIGSASGAMGPLDVPSLIFQATPASHSKEGEQG